MEKKLELVGGYTDPKGITHREVVIGRRLRGADLFAIDDDRLSALPTNREFLMLSKAIAQFGTLKLPVPLTTLLSLDSIDRDDLVEAFNEAEGGEDKAAEILSESKVRLADGLDVAGVVYDVVEFGNRLKGYDYAEADKLELEGARKTFYLIGRQVSKIGQAVDYRIDFKTHLSTFTDKEKAALERMLDGREDAAAVAEAVSKVMWGRADAPGYTATLNGPLDLELIEKFYARDLYAMRSASELWRQSFRRPRKEVQGGDGGERVRADEGDGQAGG